MIIKRLADAYLKARGWTVRNDLPPDLDTFVVIAAPHTSNWDFPVTLAIAASVDLDFYWVGKDSLFRGPMGPVMRRLGGIPVDRSRSTNFVDQVAEVMRESEGMALGIAPEGTRSKGDYWKSGFYYIARSAGVPIVCGFVDWEKREGGLGPVVDSSLSKEEVLAELEAFYAGLKGKRPDQYTPPKFRGR